MPLSQSTSNFASAANDGAETMPLPASPGLGVMIPGTSEIDVDKEISGTSGTSGIDKEAQDIENKSWFVDDETSGKSGIDKEAQDVEEETSGKSKADNEAQDAEKMMDTASMILFHDDLFNQHTSVSRGNDSMHTHLDAVKIRESQQTDEVTQFYHPWMEVKDAVKDKTMDNDSKLVTLHFFRSKDPEASATMQTAPNVQVDENQCLIELI